LKIPPANDTRVVYGVFDLVAQHLRSHPRQESPIFADTPSGPEDLNEIAIAIAESILGERPAGRGKKVRH
jgi:hypothetical protein